MLHVVSSPRTLQCGEWNKYRRADRYMGNLSIISSLSLANLKMFT